MMIFKIPHPLMENRELHRDSYPDGRVRLKVFDPDANGEPRYVGFLTEEPRFKPLLDLGPEYAVIGCGEEFLAYLVERGLVEYVRHIDEPHPWVNMPLVRVLI